VLLARDLLDASATAEEPPSATMSTPPVSYHGRTMVEPMSALF
jgi:hypothetical protein